MTLTDLLIAAILIVLLVQWHQKEKGTGRYGKLYALITKRFRRYIKEKFYQKMKGNR